MKIPTADTTEIDTWPIETLLEGRHFYMEGGYTVFTEHYHLSRGVCCGSGCRHCPYKNADEVILST